MYNKKLVVVCGPTASGKTSLAVAIAKRIGGEIISADSRQVYRGMDIGTGKDLNEYHGDSFAIPYHLIDICDPETIYTLHNYIDDFYAVYDSLKKRNVYGILTGGTGLYIEAVLKGYDLPSIPEDADFRNRFREQEKDLLAHELEKCAPDLYKKTDLNSKKRIIRALEIAHYRSHITTVPKTRPKIDSVIMCTMWERKQLWERIDKRLANRLNAGMIDEVQRILDSGITRERFSMFGMEYKFIAQFIDKEVSYNEMVDKLKIAIHQLSKRQETWFRGMERRGCSVHWVENARYDVAMKILRNEQVVKNSI
ncbi:MAG: tRNA (adenosine(37)-N6)-dimethylallyltransferase MiaA [Fibrobacter sp.]|nr:tRNA (adenosine(37)-N6)-dimethylallyltransferase MiaA [Fibrobacter sp.]